MSLKQVLDLVSFINTLELLLPTTLNTPSEDIYINSPNGHSELSHITEARAASANPPNLDGTTETPPTAPEDMIHQTSGSASSKEGDIPKSVETDNGNEAALPSGASVQKTPKEKPVVDHSRFRFWYFNKPSPNSRVSQVLPFQRLSTLLSTSLSGGAPSSGSGNSVKPKSPLAGAAQTTPLPVGDDSGISGSSMPHTDEVPTATNSSKGNGLQRPKNPLGRILEEEHSSGGASGVKKSPAVSEDTHDVDQHAAAMLRSQSNILGALFLNATPRPKPSATDTLLYWLLQDHTGEPDIPGAPRGQDYKSLFRLMVCLWAEPVVGSGPFNKEWKKLLREREMRKWSEAGGEGEVNVVSVLAMMSLFGAETGLGLCRGESKMLHQPVAVPLQNRSSSSTTSKSQDDSTHKVTVRNVEKGGMSANMGDRTAPNSREQMGDSCPVCKRKGNNSAVCPCARTLLQGMGVFAPTIPGKGQPSSPTSNTGSANGRRQRQRSSSEASRMSKARSLPLALASPGARTIGTRPHSASNPQRVKPKERRRPSTAIRATTAGSPESTGSASSRLNEWIVGDEGGVAKTEKIEDGYIFTQDISTIQLEWDSAGSPSLVMSSQNADFSPRQPLLAESDTTDTPDTDHNAQEVLSECEQDVNSTLVGVNAKLRTENVNLTETPIPVDKEPNHPVSGQATPLTNKEVNLPSENARKLDMLADRDGKRREVA